MRPIRLLAAVGALCWCAVVYAGPAVQINEIRIDQPSLDNDEYFELTGLPGTSLTGLTYLVLGDGAIADGSGVVESVTDLTGFSINASGFFVRATTVWTGALGVADVMIGGINLFENSDNVTHMLVSGFTGAAGDDLDTNDNGVLDSTPWTAVIDKIALIEEQNPPAATEFHYGPPTVGPDQVFVPGHAYRCSPGGAWVIGPFDPAVGEDTAGAVNPDCTCGDPGTGNCFQVHATPYCEDGVCCDLVCLMDPTCCMTGWDADCTALAASECTVPGPAPAVTLNEIRTGQTGNDNDEYFELKAAPFTSLDGVAYIVIGDGAGNNNGVIEDVAVLSGNVVVGSGLFVGAEDTFTLGLADIVGDFNFEDSDNVTHMLVFNFTGSDNDDLDMNNDGLLDVTPWGEIIDSVAIVGPNTPGVDGDHIYSATTVGPDGVFTPGQVYLCTPTGTWKVGPFNTADPGETDTPGEANTSCTFVPPCGSSQAGDCFEPHANANCSNAGCCGLVCMTSPSCCSTAWTQACADQAQVQCLSCGDPTTGSCFELGTTPYCEDAECCSTVCLLDPTCCSADWDQDCVDLANGNCKIVKPANVMITEIVDGTLPGGLPKWVELSNCDLDAVDLADYSIGNFNNGSPTMGAAATVLSGVVNTGESFVFSYSPDADPTFMSVYSFAPDQFHGVAAINGNDAVVLFFGAATGDGSDAQIVDIYGEIGVDGLGQAWDYTDSYASRNAGLSANPIFTAAEWTFGGPGALVDPNGDDMIETMNLQQNTFPDVYDCQAGPGCPACFGDSNNAGAGDGTVDANDLALLLGDWGPAPFNDACHDFNGDGLIDAADLAPLLGNWGPC